MDIKKALQGQYHAAFRMLRECVELCPDELWTAGKGSRQYWRIVNHAAFFGHLYMCQNEAAFTPWSKQTEAGNDLWEGALTQMEPYTKEELLSYIDEVRSIIDPTIDALDLDTEDPGFPWYKNINKLEHEILSIRHVQGHVGQLSELLMAAGIDSSWIARRA